ncbi:MAG: hypothetical protein ABEN55_11430 [Bradymonadaceae bacterium]
MSGTYVSSIARWTIAALVAAIGVVVGAEGAVAGPWVKSPGKSYLKISGELFDSGRTFDVEGQAMEAMPAYSHIGVRSYGEVGIVPRISLGWSLPFLIATNTLEDGRSFRRLGLGDLDLRADVQIVDGTCAVAGELEARIPLYGETVGVGDQATASMNGSDAERYRPILGDGSHELAPGLAAGCGFGIGWARASAGPRFRFDGFGDGIDWSVGAGAYLWPDRLALQIGASGLERFTAHDPRPTKRFASARAGLLVNVAAGIAIEGGAGYTFDGAFVAAGWSGAVGVSYPGRLFPDPFGNDS